MSEVEAKVNSSQANRRELLQLLASAREVGIAEWLRMEWRLSSAKAIREILGFDSLQALIDNYSQRTHWFDDALKRDLFRLDISAMAIVPPSEAAAAKGSKLCPVNPDLQSRDLAFKAAIDKAKVDPATSEKWERVLNTRADKTDLPSLAARLLWDSGCSDLGEDALKNVLKATGATPAQIERLKALAMRSKIHSILPDGQCWQAVYGELQRAALAPAIQIQPVAVPLPEPRIWEELA